MPTTKSSKHAPVSGTTAATLKPLSVAAATATTTFIARLTRQQLEQLVQESVTSGVAPTLAGIKHLLPMSLRTQEVKKVNVAGGDERQVNQRHTSRT